MSLGKGCFHWTSPATEEAGSVATKVGYSSPNDFAHYRPKGWKDNLSVEYLPDRPGYLPFRHGLHRRGPYASGLCRTCVNEVAVAGAHDDGYVGLSIFFEA